jgi:hypothetical protein
LVVAPRGIPAGRRVQEFEAHAIPFPAPPSGAAQRFGHQRIERVARRQRGCKRLDLHGFQHRERTAEVVDVLVADYHQVEAVDSRAAQHRHDDAPAAVGLGAVCRAGVVKQRAACGAHHDREALPHVECGDPGFAGGRRGRR